MLCASLHVRRRRVRRVAPHARRVPRRTRDRDPARAPMGEPARGRDATAPRAADVSPRGPDAPPTIRTACRSTATSSASSSRCSSTNDTRLVATLDYGALSGKLRAFPFPHIAHGRRAPATRRAGSASSPSVEPDDGPRAVPISFGWHPFLQLPDTPRAEWELRWPACEHVEVDERVDPDRRAHRAAGASAHRSPGRTFDDHYALGADRTFSISAGSGATGARSRCSSIPTYPFAQLFVPPRRASSSRSNP